MMRLLAITITLVAAFLFQASSARAQDPGVDEVTLKNGGSIRGTVISSEPGTSVKILELGAKEPRVVPWAQVSDVERGKYAPKPPAQPGPAGPGYGAPPPLAVPEPALGAPGVIRLHIESPVRVQVLQNAGTTYAQAGGYGVVINQFRNVCVSPCDKVIDGSAGQAFGLVGAFPSPAAFQTVGLKGDYNLKLQPGKLGVRVGGVVLTSLGIPALVVGAIMLPIGLSSSSSFDSSTSTVRDLGIATLVGGAVALGAGIAMIATSGTKYTLDPAGGSAKGARAPRYWLGEF